jgi:hypothetical protein
MKGAVKMESTRHPSVKLPTLVIAASAVVAVGALAASVGQEQTATVAGGGMSIGATTTTTVAPTTIPIAVAHPVLKASLPKGYR